MNPTAQTIAEIAGYAIVAAVTYFKTKKSVEKKVDEKGDSVQEHLCADYAEKAKAIELKIEVVMKELAIVRERGHMTSVAVQALNTAVANQEKVLTNISDQVTKQGRLMVEVHKHKLSEKTVIPGGKKNEG